VLLPVQVLGLLGPEALGVALGVLVDRLVGDERLLAEPLRRREGLLFEQLLQVCPERGCLSMAILRSVVVGLAPALGVSQRLTRDFDG
jgi:hypothetical protein